MSRLRKSSSTKSDLESKNEAANTEASKGSIAIVGDVIGSVLRISYLHIPVLWIFATGLALAFLLASIFVIYDIFGVSAAIQKYLRIGVCFLIDPNTDKHSSDRIVGPCKSGHVSYVKWFDKNRYPGTKEFLDGSNHVFEWPNDRPNRTVELIELIEGEHYYWNERNLIRSEGGLDVWARQNHSWVSIFFGHLVPVKGKPQGNGVLLRRIDTTFIPLGNGQTQCMNESEKRSILEIFIPNNAPERIERNEKVFLWYRELRVDCDKVLEYEPFPGELFEKWHEITVAIKDK